MIDEELGWNKQSAVEQAQWAILMRHDLLGVQVFQQKCCVATSETEPHGWHFFAEDGLGCCRKAEGILQPWQMDQRDWRYLRSISFRKRTTIRKATRPLRLWPRRWTHLTASIRVTTRTRSCVALCSMPSRAARCRHCNGHRCRRPDPERRNSRGLRRDFGVACLLLRIDPCFSA